MTMIEIPPFLAALTQILLTFLTADIPEPADGHDPSVQPAALAAHAAISDAVAAANTPDRFFIAPYLLADKQTREVILLGQMTGTLAGDPVEFFAITDMSGQDYEAIMTTWITPSDLHAALEFIGLSPGGSVNTDLHRLWPRGDRVDAVFSTRFPDDPAPRDLPAHEWITRPDGSVMEPTSWVFTGAPMLPHPQNEGEEVYGADMFSPHSIASTFNLRNTLFDLPLQGAKSVVYGQYLRNPALPVRHGQPMILRLSPTPADRRPNEISLPLPLDSTESPALTELAQNAATADNTLYWVTPDFAPSLTLPQLRTLATTLNELERTHESVRITAPPAGQMYYQAFAPPERFRDRTRRPSQPLEIHLQPSADGLRVTLHEIKEIWEDTRTPRLLEKRIDFQTPSEWLAYLNANEPLIRVLFVFADETLTHRDLNHWLSEVYTLFPVIYVYGE